MPESSKNAVEGGSPPWTVDLLRLSAFPIEPPELAEPDWWEGIVGEESPDFQKKGETFAVESKFAGGKIRFGGDFNRLDWLFSPSPGEEDSPRSIDDVEGSFKSLAEQWFAVAPEIKRLAFGCILLQPVDSPADGYGLLDGYLPAVKVDAEGSRDLFYQINRPRPSAVAEGIRVNRLSKWAVRTSKLVAISGGEDLGIAGPSTFSALLELDVNTVPLDGESATLAKNDSPRLFEELMSLAWEISRNGDVP